MKFKALRTIEEPKEFVHIDKIGNTMLMYTCDLPRPQPLTATLKVIKEYYKNDIPLPDQLTLDDLELVEFEMYEADTVGSDIRNKLSPPKNLVDMLETYFGMDDGHCKEKLLILIEKEMKQTKISVEYIANLL